MSEEVSAHLSVEVGDGLLSLAELNEAVVVLLQTVCVLVEHGCVLHVLVV